MSEATLQSVEQAARHGRTVARAAVQAGLVTADQVGPLFQEYGLFVQAGVRGTFTQLLHARKVIDDEGVRLLDERASAHELLDEHRARWLGDPLLCAEAARSLVARERSSEARQLLQAGARTYPDSPHLRDPDLGED